MSLSDQAKLCFASPNYIRIFSLKKSGLYLMAPFAASAFIIKNRVSVLVKAIHPTMGFCQVKGPY